MATWLVPILENHAAQFDRTMPTAAARLREHLTETRLHATRLEQCLALLNATPSRIKSNMSSMIGTVEGAATLFRDHIVKDLLGHDASEQFEVGCYAALVSAANAVGLEEVAELCQQSSMRIWRWRDRCVSKYRLRHTQRGATGRRRVAIDRPAVNRRFSRSRHRVAKACPLDGQKLEYLGGADVRQYGQVCVE
jgi:hypothetical protein